MLQAQLPEEETEFILSLDVPERNFRLRQLHEAGWSLSALAQSVKTPKTTVHFWVTNAKNAKAIINWSNRAIPAPHKAVTALIPSPYSTRVRSMSPKVPPDLRPRLARLGQVARRYRSKTLKSSATAQANAELTRLAVLLRKQGVPTADIAEAAGVSYRAMARRISKATKDG